VEKRKTKKYSPCVVSPAGKPTGEAYGLADQSMKKPILVSLILSNNRLKALMLEKKVKVKTDVFRSIGKQSGESVESASKNKKKATVGRIYRLHQLLGENEQTGVKSGKLEVDGKPVGLRSSMHARKRVHTDRWTIRKRCSRPHLLLLLLLLLLKSTYQYM